MIEKKIIQSYTNNSTTDKVHFEIIGYGGKDMVKDFKLQKTFHMSNMHLFHPTKGIHKYESPEEILSDFVDIRLGTYKKRKIFLVKSLEVKKNKNENISRFIKSVIDEKLVVFRKKKADLEAEMATMKFDKVEGTYDYLLNIKTYQYTHEALESLDTETKKLRDDLENLKATGHVDMWKNDLKIYAQ